MKTAVLTLIFAACIIYLFSQATDSLTDTPSLPAEKQSEQMGMEFGVDFSTADQPPYLTNPAAQDSVHAIPVKLPYHESFLAGVDAASQHVEGVEWGLGGFLCGVSLNAVGAGIVYLTAATLGRSRPLDIPHQYSRKAFREGYTKRSLYINRGAALIGGAVGTALQVILLITFFAAVDAADDDDTYRELSQAVPANQTLGLNMRF
jgi:hypothetical protein